jgi:nucleolar protein 56
MKGQVNDHLKAFLEMNLPKAHKHKSALGVSDPKLAGSIKDVLGKGYGFDTGDITQDLLRGVRLHGPKMLKTLQPGDLEKAQLGLGHSYSRAKVKFNVNKSDNMIIQAIALLDQLDKDINTFAMRVRYPLRALGPRSSCEIGF